MDGFLLSLIDTYKLWGCVSKSGKFVVQSNDQRIYLRNFSTKEFEKIIKKKHHLIKDISENEKYCVFISNGETCINVLQLPDLNEVFSLNCEYVFQIGFISNCELIFLDGRRDIKIVNFISKETKTITLTTESGFYLVNTHFVGNGLDISYYNNQTYLLKCFNVTATGVHEYTKEVPANCWSCSQIVDFKVIVCTKEPEKSFFSIYIWDVLTSDMNFIATVQGTPCNVKWIDGSYIWCSYSCSAFCNFLKIFDSNGNVLFKYIKTDYPLYSVYCRFNNHILASGFGESYLFRLN